jgi:hypothetical protein
MITPEHKETRMTLIGHLITLAEKDVDFFHNTIIVSATKMCSERTMIRERRGSHCKSSESTDRRIEKWLPGMLPKVLKTLAKVSALENY